MKAFSIKFRVVILFILLVFYCTNSTQACSAFHLKRSNCNIVGFNENWKTMSGMVIVNKRNILKESLSWSKMISTHHNELKTVKWKSKYGSVSFNLFGIDMPCYGLNEKGLFVVELYLDKTFSKPDASKFNMFWAQ